MNIEEYEFERSDLVVVTAVNAYLKNLTPEARRETLGEIVKFRRVAAGRGRLSESTFLHSGTASRCGGKKVCGRNAEEVHTVHKGLRKIQCGFWSSQEKL